MSAHTAKPVLFFAFASELAGVTLPLLADEVRRLRAVLRPAEDAGWCEVVVRQTVTLADILNVFHDPRYHARIALFHFSGHADAYALLLTDAKGDAQSIHAAGFAAFLAEQPGLDVVVLNACSTQPQVDDLLAAGVKAVIATGAEIPDDWALAFAERVYAGLAGGSGLASAFRAAEGALRAELGEQEWPWGIFPAPDGGTLAVWRLKTVQVAPSTYLWVNVPAKPAEPLLGRDALLDDLVSRLHTGLSPALSTDGLPGVGKTALAVALAHDERIRSHFADGVLWGGLGVNPDVVTIQNQWATAVGADLADEPDMHRRRQRLSAAVGERRVLVVIDDAWDVETAQALRLSSPHVVHLLTTRDRKIARDFAGAGQQVHVPELAEAPAWALLERLAPEACAADPDAARHLVRTVGELPLAIEVLGGYLAGPVLRKAQMGALAAMTDARRRLALASERLGGQPGKKETLDAVIRLSVEALPEDVQAVFWALGAFAPKPATFDLAAAEAVTAAPTDRIDLLAQRNLVEVGDDETLAVHQVVHDVMAGATPGAAVERHTGYYLDLVNEDRDDWLRIESVYEQVRFAWQSLVSGAASAQLFEFVWRLRVYQERRGIWRDKLAWCERALTYAQAEDMTSEQASILVNLGSVYDALGEKAKALSYYEQALPLYRQVGDKGGEATTLNNLGRVYSDLGEKAKALSYYEQALPLYRQVGDKGGEATTLNNLGRVYADLGEKAKALSYYEQALPLYRQVGDKGGEATTLNNLGSVYSALGEKAKALSYYEQALPLYRQVGDKGGEATTLNNLGLVYADLGEKAKALSYYEQALPLRRQVGDKGGEATTLNNLGSVYSALGEKAKALSYYEQALPLYRQVGDKGGEATTLNNLGYVYAALGEKAKALSYYEQALPLYRQVGDKGGEATTLNNLGYVYADLGEKAKALSYYEQALPLRRQVGDKGGEATTLNNLGLVYADLGEKAKALSYYEQALPLYRQVGDKGREATTLNNLGSVYSALGEKAKALSYYEQALPLRRQVGDKGGEATTLNNLGSVYSDLGEKAKALSYYEQALPLCRQVGDRWGESVTRFNMAMVAEALGDLAKAEAELQIVVGIDEAVGHPDLASDRQALERIRQKMCTGV